MATWWDEQAELTPSQVWEGIIAQQDPTWAARGGLGQRGEQLAARYMLGAPTMGQMTGEGGFAAYIPGYTGGAFGGWEQSYEGLLAEAQNAAYASIGPQGQYLTQFADDPEAFQRQTWYADRFGPTEEQTYSRTAMQNQLAAATILAQQRRGESVGDDPVYGMTQGYRGAMGEAISRGMARMQRYREAVAPNESFLDWYVRQLTE